MTSSLSDDLGPYCEVQITRKPHIKKVRVFLSMRLLVIIARSMCGPILHNQNDLTLPTAPSWGISSVTVVDSCML